MDSLKRFATSHPILFGVFITFVALVFYVCAGIFSEVVTQDRAGQDVAEALGRLFGSGLFVYLLWRFGWFQSAGLASAGRLSAWLVVLPIVAYEVFIYQIPLFGDTAFTVTDPRISIPVGLNALMTGPLEEIPFRGIILYSFLHLWGDTKKGMVRSVLLASLLFSSSHLIHLLTGKPVDMVLMKVVMTFLSGIYLAALVLKYRTLWTVIVFHGILNAYMSIRAVEVAGFTETATGLAFVVLLQLPVVIFGVYLISTLPNEQGSMYGMISKDE